MVLSGCLTVGMGVDATVAGEDEIERYELQMNVSGGAYAAMQESGQGLGGVSGRAERTEAQIASNVTGLFDDVGEVETEVTERAERMTITVTIRDAVPSDGGDLTVTRDGGSLTYRDEVFDRSFGGEAAGFEDPESGRLGEFGEPELHLRYALEMPGTVRDSNADTTDGAVARWNRSYTGDEIDDAGFVVRAESDVGGGGMPGFGAIVAVAVVLTVGLLATRRQR